MPFLKRSKSQKATAPREAAAVQEVPDKKLEAKLEQGDAAKERRRSRFQRRKSEVDRSDLVDASKNTERPRTANRAIERRKELEMTNETIEIRTGGTTFAFPTPSPRLPPPRSSTFQPSPTPSPLANTDLPPIGTAIGSPSFVPTWGRSYTADNVTRRTPKRTMTTISPAVLGPLDEDGPKPELRKKKSGWKTLGGLFRSKTTKPAVQEPFYKVQPGSDPVQSAKDYLGGLRTPTRSPGSAHSPGSISSHHSRTPSVTRGMARFEARAQADRASFMPNIDSKMHRTPSMIQRDSMIAAPRLEPLPRIRDSEDIFIKIETADGRKDSPMSDTGVRVPGAIPRTPRLDLDIPNGEMERYSVMFEKLLEPRQSILERRQSKKMKKLQSDAQKGASATTSHAESSRVPHIASLAGAPSTARMGMPKRSVTSPHLNRTLSLKIHVASEKNGNSDRQRAGSSSGQPTTAVHRPRPIKRSKTAPVGSVLPLAHNFSRPKAPALALSDSEASPTSPLYGDNSLPPTPTTYNTCTDNESLAILGHHAGEFSLPLPRVRRGTDDEEPSWEMLTSKAPSHLSAPQTDHDPDSDGEGLLGRDLYPRVKSPEDLERQIVQVSVARQVSVSRARRQVQKAVASKQPLRPRVVELSKNRKSTMVLIEGGDD